MRDTVAARARSAGTAAPALLIGLVSVAVVGAVWVLQWRGFAPCELCLKERVPYYAAIAFSAGLAAASPRLPSSATRIAYGALLTLFVGSAVLGAYHAGVEWKMWAGPTECSGAVAAPEAVGDFLKQLQGVTVVRCDVAALAVLGISLAAWNALLSTALAAVAASGMRRPRLH